MDREALINNLAAQRAKDQLTDAQLEAELKKLVKDKSERAAIFYAVQTSDAKFHRSQNARAERSKKLLLFVILAAVCLPIVIIVTRLNIPQSLLDKFDSRYGQRAVLMFVTIICVVVAAIGYAINRR